MKCPDCGTAELKQDTRDVPFSYKGKTTVVPRLTGQFCDACGNSVLTKADQDRYAAEATRFRQVVDKLPVR
ncbi:hypothetical protein C0Z18_09785 [Trinickia dabaoshanensis]|uniref:YgiT-type zinc finger domain-containing protein n=1 Tax=Trinickia dabaoshanensis TaxID=564714 RepID=A0A2N7VUK0_9BURK|nr:type II toxin-antitoxin system MqsA family antitoxin [Trinickia dabaoshanensis]PMS20820.1 hypothetical protein C0Z18_09785 [Trinickia dabaoshanensis]